jgi:hypothetical protein
MVPFDWGVSFVSRIQGLLLIDNVLKAALKTVAETTKSQRLFLDS